MTKQNCVYSYIFHTYKHISMYLYRRVEYLLRMEFSSLSTVGNPEDSFSPLLLFSAPQISLSVLLPPQPPPCYTHSLLSFSPHQYHIFPTQQLFNRQLALVFCAAEGGRENGTEEIYPMSQPGNKTIDSKYKAKV